METLSTGFDMIAIDNTNWKYGFMLNWITSKCSYSSQFLHEKGWPNRFHVQDELSRSIRIEGYLWHSHLPRCLLLCSTKQIFCKQNEDWDITVFPERSPSVVFLPLISFVQPWVSAEYNAVVLVPKREFFLVNCRMRFRFQPYASAALTFVLCTCTDLQR